MNSEVLIDQLSRDVRPVRADAVKTTLRRALFGGAAAAGIIVLFWPSMGLRPDIGTAILTPAFWVKTLYAAAIAVLGFAALERMARPESDRPNWLRLIWLPLAILSAITAMRWTSVPAGEGAAFWMGSSWWQCPFYVVGLSIPILVAFTSALSRLAPTRLAAAGAAAGLAAGGTGAGLYALHCTESSPGFLLVWYSLGVAAACGAGAALGPRLLQW